MCCGPRRSQGTLAAQTIGGMAILLQVNYVTISPKNKNYMTISTIIAILAATSVVSDISQYDC